MGLSVTPILTVSVNPTATVTKLDTDERIFGSQVTVELDNSDDSLDAASYNGKPITFSLTPGGGIPAMYVWSQEHDSREGKKILRLNCVDAWTLLSTCQVTIGSQYWNNPGMLDPDTGNPWARFADYYDKPVDDIITAVLNSTISGSLVNGAAMPTLLKPNMAINNAYTGIREALGYTPGYLRVSGTAFTYVDPSALGVVNTYDTDDATSVTILGSGVTVPNRVYVVAIDPDVTDLMQEDNPVIYTGSAQDDDSHTALGVWIDYYYTDFSGSLVSDANCDTLAETILDKFQAEKAQGLIVTAHTTSQQLLEKITGTDARGNSVTGVIYRIRRTYDRGEYSSEFTLGGAVGGYTAPHQPNPIVPGGTTPMPFPTPDWDLPPWGDILPKAVQGYTHNVIFSATDWDTVEWTVGGIKFYDGTTQAIAAGNTGNLADDNIYYIYFDLNDASPNVLKVAQADIYRLFNFSEYTSVLCVVQRSPYGATGSAVFLPGWEKQPFITTDYIHMEGIKDWTDPITGYRYQQIADTQISAGLIHLSSSTSFAADYDPTDKFDLDDDDLDDIDNGTTYAKLRATDISSGHIKLTSAVVVDGEWYNESGVEIDADNGINIYGKNNALTTRATKTGTIQCYVGSDGAIYAGAGKVKLSSGGLDIYDSNLAFFSGVTDYGGIYGGGSNLTIASNYGLVLASLNGYELAIQSDDRIYMVTPAGYGVEMQSCDHMLLPRLTSAPSGLEGKMVYNNSTGNLNIYHSGWYHVNLTSGWA